VAPVVTPPVRISAPSPGALRYGIFNVSDVVPFTDSHQHFAGMTYDAQGCGTARGWPIVCDAETPAVPKTFDPNTGETVVKPFAVYTSLLCGTAGYTAEYLEDKVRMRLAATEQGAVEAAFSSGVLNGTTLGNTPILAAGGGVTVLTAAASLKAGVAALEEYAGDNYGYRPVIHAPAYVAAHAGSNGLIRESLTSTDAQPLRTFLGSLWSFGAGYSNTSPTGTAVVAGHAWLYVTGRVTLWQNTSVFVSPAKQTANRVVNQYNLIAEREWAASYDCFVAAIDVTL
jgi:hypothetical protein